MYDMNNYDNDLAYGYDKYIESEEEEQAYLEDRAVDDEMLEHFEPYEYESKMAEQMIDSLYNFEK